MQYQFFTIHIFAELILRVGWEGRGEIMGAWVSGLNVET